MGLKGGFVETLEDVRIIEVKRKRNLAAEMSSIYLRRGTRSKFFGRIELM